MSKVIPVVNGRAGIKLRHSLSKADSISHYALLHIYRPGHKHVYIIKKTQMKDINSFLNRMASWKRKRKLEREFLVLDWKDPTNILCHPGRSGQARQLLAHVCLCALPLISLPKQHWTYRRFKAPSPEAGKWHCRWSLCGEEALSSGCLSYLLNCPEHLSRITQLAVYIDQINHKSPSPQLKLMFFKTFQGLGKLYSISSWDSLFSA